MDSQSEAPHTPTLPKACENCRIRKIRCSRQIPCTNCETSGIQCKPAIRSTGHKPRVLLSANYEKHIEKISDRLSGIEDAIRSLKIGKLDSSPALLSEATPAISESARSQISSTAAFEGASSLTSQAIEASEAAGKSLQSIQGSVDVLDALSSLRTSLDGINDHRKQPMRLGITPTPQQAPNTEQLPAEFVLKLLHEFRERRSVLLLSYGFYEGRQLEQLCQKVYFPTEPVSLSTLTLMNGMLYLLLDELTFGKEYGRCSGYDLEALKSQAELNFHQGIESYEVFANPSLDSARCLMIAMFKAQGEGKPLLTWTFASAGARQVLSLGYHRKATLKNDPFDVAEDKRKVFWGIYTVDKQLSLNMGYSPTIQDYDIDAEYFQCSLDPSIGPWDKAAIATIELARVQGLIYERLYSLRALYMAPEEKARVIDELSRDLEAWHENWQQINTESAYALGIFFLIYGAFDVIFYSLVTTLHRAGTPSHASVEITSACYEAAKKSLQAHFQFFPAFKSWDNVIVLSSYVSGILLYCSWTPLIVVFLHAIASSNRDDVRLLEEVRESLKPLQGLNHQADQLYHLCQTFSKLAKAFVDQHSTFVGTYNEQEDLVVLPQQDAPGQLHSTMMNPPAMQQVKMGLQYPDFEGANLDGTEMDAMSMFLGGFLGGSRPMNDLWAMDFTDNDGS